MRLKLEWEIPGQQPDEIFLEELAVAVKLETAVRLFAQRRISSGYAAVLLGIPRIVFLDIVRERQVPLFEFGDGELQSEVDSLAAAISDTV